MEADLQEPANVDTKDLIQENLQYKRIQKNLATQLRAFESKIRNIKVDVNALQKEAHQKE